MGWAAKVDGNHAAIVKTFRRLGCSVLDLSRVGQGCPDLLIGFAGTFALVEVKALNGKPTPAQVLFAKDWAVHTVRDNDGAALVAQMLREKAYR